MMMWTVFWLFMVFTGSALAEEDGLLVSCNRADIECLSKSTTTFLGRTYQGDARYGFVPIDPVNIPSRNVEFDDSVGIIYKYKNVIVKGLKHQTISDFKMDTTAKSVVLTTKADLDIVADVTVEFPKKAKSFTGSVTGKGSVLGTATYNYELNTNDKGVRHFEVGPETITCQVVTIPVTQTNPELAQALLQDDDFNTLSKQKIEELRAKAFCELVRESYKSVIHNIRTAAKLLPASSFFKDI
ncbi:hypothetical protein MSG28_009641 [Choristoneura fumiferana]|uniref:Uncharacterized protein n=2 Tax=Choristoneura fumiferana TaxID=7141 RepID=A0ACC0JCA8_CHOFU|nr:hypothetical protein MSG28_009640 [Choristoneura fumiferana]KAI8421649.1 hypothetical protein MSG28_009641 [Choristoneura fumiferana]